MAESAAAQWLNRHGKSIISRQYVDRRTFTTAAGPLANRKIEIGDPDRTSIFFQKVTEAIADWAVRNEVTMLAAVPSGANRYTVEAGYKGGIPFVIHRKVSEGFELLEERLGGLSVIEDNPDPLVCIIEDVRSTGYSMSGFAEKVFGESVRLRGLSVVDRGQDVAGVSTLEEARTYAQANPAEPPAHIALPFECDTLIKYPLALFVKVEQ